MDNQSMNESSSDEDSSEAVSKNNSATSTPVPSPDGSEHFGGDTSSENEVNGNDDDKEEDEGADQRQSSDESESDSSEALEGIHVNESTSEEEENDEEREVRLNDAARALFEGMKREYKLRKAKEPRGRRRWWDVQVNSGWNPINVAKNDGNGGEGNDVNAKKDLDLNLTSLSKKELRNLRTKLLEDEKELNLKHESNSDDLGELHGDVAVKEKKIQELKRRILEQKQKQTKRDQLPVEGTVASNEINDGRKNAQFILPEEIWKIIVESVKDPQDQRSCSETCQLFLKFLIPQRFIWGFDKALKYFYRYLDDNSILACRLVCKGWRLCVDHFFSHHRTLQPHSSVNFDPRYNPSVLIPFQHTKVGGYEFSNHSQFLYFGRSHLIWTMRGTSSSNPFISRFLRITEYDKDDEGCETVFTSSAYWRAIYTFLENLGEHIWYLSFSTNVKERDIEMHSVFKRFFLKDLFRLVPNLKLLRISGHLCKYFLRYSYDLNKEDVPPAAFLETLQIDDNTYDRSHPVLEALLKRYHKQLRRLHIKYDLWKSVSHLEWKKLVEIHVEEIETSEELSSLKRLKDSSPNLQKLGISLSGYEKDSLKVLLEVLNVLGENTKLNVFRFSGGGLPKICLSNLPSSFYAPYCLKTLEFELVIEEEFVLTSDFLMRFPFLQNLNVFLRRNFGKKFPISPSRDMIYLMEHYHTGYYRRFPKFVVEALEKKEEMELYGGLLSNQIYLSTIWDYIPCLKTITFQGNIYSRDVDEKLLKAEKEVREEESKEEKNDRDCKNSKEYII